MAKASGRLSRLDWINAGFRALAARGPQALRIEALAREVGATKGSFYWHFKGPDALQSAMLAHWQQAAFSDVVQSLDQLPPGRARLEELTRLAAAAPEEAGGRDAEPAIRDWARYDAGVADVLGQVDAARQTWLRSAFAEAGMTDQAAAEAATILYAVLIGLEQLEPEEKRRRDLLGRTLGALLG